MIWELNTRNGAEGKNEKKEEKERRVEEQSKNLWRGNFKHACDGDSEIEVEAEAEAEAGWLEKKLNPKKSRGRSEVCRYEDNKSLSLLSSITYPNRFSILFFFFLFLIIITIIILRIQYNLK